MLSALSLEGTSLPVSDWQARMDQTVVQANDNAWGIGQTDRKQQENRVLYANDNRYCFVLPISRNHSLFVLIRLVGINVCIERTICQRSASKSLGGSMSGIFFGERFSLFWAASFDRLENHGICFCRWHFLLFCHQKLYEEGSCGKINMKNK